jgi:hypothetical protein
LLRANRTANPDSVIRTVSEARRILEGLRAKYLADPVRLVPTTESYASIVERNAAAAAARRARELAADEADEKMAGAPTLADGTPPGDGA